MRHIPLSVAFLLVACAGAPPPHPIDALIGAPGVVTLVNLRPDEQRARLFSANYQQNGLIPVCSAVALLDRSRERLVFEVNETGKTYEYYHHDAAAEPLPDHLVRVFGTSCDRKAITALSKIDQDGVRQGKPLVGMSKRGVVFAMGYPPRHMTPSLEADRWLYWLNRFNREAVVFDEKGLVQRIEN